MEEASSKAAVVEAVRRNSALDIPHTSAYVYERFWGIGFSFSLLGLVNKLRNPCKISVARQAEYDRRQDRNPASASSGSSPTHFNRAGQATWRNAETHTMENVGKNEAHSLDIELKK